MFAEDDVTAIIENRVEIARSPEDVFDYLSNMANEVEWNPDCVSIEQLTDGPTGIGSRFRAKWKQGPFVVTECTSHDRPRTWTYLNGGPISVALTVTLEPTPGGTRLISRGEWTPHGSFRLIFPVFIRRMRRAEVGVVGSAKTALENFRDRQ